MKLVGDWTNVDTGHPEPHRKCLVRRAGSLFTATPVYGLHDPWWAVRTMDGEAPPVPFRAGDEWCELP